MIKLLVLDVDGCMTDGSITFDENGVESKSFNVKDGLGITTWLKMGGDVAIITGRESKIMQRRAKELGVKHLYQKEKRKKERLLMLLNELGIALDEVAAIGDDLNDLAMLQAVGMSFTPANGMGIIQKEVDIVLSKKGGEGAVREMIDIVVKHNNQEEAFISVWR